tara:strand:+ start:1522 stop:3042 length:1521 start_codon:yes stop_codon:yes gene_type:complete
MQVSITAVKDFKISKIDKRIYGSFLEHLGRAIYEGIYEPDHPDSDENGFRQDVMKLITDLNMPTVRYPGGNYISSFNWEDSIGPIKDRPTRLDLAWKTRETNEFGLNEFVTWCKKTNIEPMYAINLGTRGIDAARNILEYCNHPRGSYWSDLRIKHGYKDPHNIKMWCLGNEMDGEWQVGHKTAYEYGRLVHEVAKSMRKFDSSLELIIAGSSSEAMKTYPDWEREILENSYESIDYIALHKYWTNYDKNTTSYLSSSIPLQEYISTVEGTINYIKAKKRSKKQIKISFDEWNPWYHSRDMQTQNFLDKNLSEWPKAPPLYEDMYNILDTLLVGTVLNTFINNSHIVKIGCMAQLVNVIPAISTIKGGISWAQGIYYPLYFASLYGRGESLQLKIDCPKYSTDIADDVKYIDASGVINNENNELSFFIINRSEKDNININFNLKDIHIDNIIDQQIINNEDMYAANTKDKPKTIQPKKSFIAQFTNNQLSANLPFLTYLFVRLKLK